MARMQYRPAARRRGFQTQQLSTAGIAQMREQSNRIVQHMERTRIAEKEQRDKDLQAMKENAEYTRGIRRENQEILLRNTENEYKQEMADIQGAAKQAVSFAQAPLNILESIADFSQTAAKAKANKDAADLKEALNNERDYEYKYDPTEEVEETIKARKQALQAGQVLGTEIAINGIESNEDRLDTLKGHLTNPVHTGETKRIIDNKYAYGYYERLFRSRTLDNKRKYTSAAGQEYTGAQVMKDHKLMMELQQQTWKDTMMYMGNPKRLYMSEAYREKINFDKGNVNKSYTAEIRVVEAQASDQINTLYSSNSLDSATQAFHQNKNMFGTVQAHNTHMQKIADPNLDIDILRQVSPTGSGKPYDEEWPNRWNPAIQERNKNITKQIEAEEKFKKAEDREWVTSNINEIREAYIQDPKGTARLALERYHSKGMTLPPIIKNIEADALKRHKDLVEHAISERTRFGNLDLTFVNSIADPTLQKNAMEAFERQEIAKYGEEAFGIKKGLLSKARTLTKINPNEDQGSSQTFLVHARLQSEYLKQLKLTNDPTLALQKINEMVDTGTTNNSSPFYVKTGLNNRLVFPNIESSPRERQEMNNYIDKLIIKNGTGVVDLPFTLADPNEMDATYSSASTGGVIQYPAGVIRFADKFGFKPSEVYNAQRSANNAVTGEPKPLLAPSPASVAIDKASPKLRKLFLSDVDQKVERGVVQAQGLLSTRVRPSMVPVTTQQSSQPTAREVYDYIRSKGVSDTHAKGILANIQGESSFNPAAVGDSGVSGGFFQHHADRFDKLKQAVPDWEANWKGQIDFALQDDVGPQYLATPYADPVAAADAFMTDYERPAEEVRGKRRQLNRTFIPTLGF